MAVMTSGTYRNFFESGGKSYSHIINPKTGMPVSHKTLSTTVLHEDPTLADAWSTALLCLGEDQGIKLADEQRLKALFIYREGDQLKEQMSAELTNQFKATPAPEMPANP
jgi:thiamine biosynthesis lipoprotein